MKIKKQELIDAMASVKPGLTNKTIIEQTDHFIFDEGYLRTYNDEFAISSPCDIGFSAAIKADVFSVLIDKINSEEIDITLKDTTIEIKTEKITSEIVFDEEISCPRLTITKKRWRSLPEDFSSGIKLCVFSADKNMLLRELTCLFIDGSNILSADNYRATRFVMKSKITDSFLLPATSAAKLAVYKPNKYLIDEGWIHFKNKQEVLFSCRIVDGEYPSTVDNLFGEADGEIIKFPGGFLDIVQRASVFAQDSEDGLISISIKKGKLLCKGEGSLGWLKEEMKINCKTEFKFSASYDALIEIIPKTPQVIVIEDKLLFKGDNFEHIICLYE